MNEVKTWADIDASPLLQLPPEERERLKETKDERFRTFWADCFTAALKPGEKGEKLNGDDFCEAFVKAFVQWEPKPGQTFSMYLRTAVRHAKAHDQQQEEMAVTGFGRETNRKIKKALEYMEKNGITESELCRDPEKEQVIADIVGVGVKTLREALRNKQSVLSLDDTGGEDSALGDRVASQEKSVEEQAEQSSEMLAWLHRGIGLMNLQQKEKYGKSSGPLWSSVLMGFLRNNDALDPAEDAPARLANCDDLRPLEQDNCLWDILLLHRYVEFTVQPPYAPKALECAAVHALLEPGRNPAQDKTVAEFLGVSKAAVSQRRKTWQQKLMQMKAEQEEVSDGTQCIAFIYEPLRQKSEHSYPDQRSGGFGAEKAQGMSGLYSGTVQ